MPFLHLQYTEKTNSLIKFFYYENKSITIFDFVFFCSLFTYAADEDITPGHLKFADKAAGPYEFVHYSSTGANPTSPYPAENLKEDGTVVLTGGQVKDETGVAILNKGCHIVASEYGNMLLIKGNGSTEQPDLSAADALGGYANIHMFTQTDFPINTPVRFSFCIEGHRRPCDSGL